jgi:hypothetical protein
MRSAFNAQSKERVEYERSKSAESAAQKLTRYLRLDAKTLETKLSDNFFRSLIENNVETSFEFLNNSVRDSNRFNIYAIEKAMLNLLSIAQNRLIVKANKYDIAMILHCIAQRSKESFTFARSQALHMLSRACVDESVARSSYEMRFDVTASTASTQVSSSFRMLQALNVLTFDDSSKERSVVSNVNVDHALVRLVASTYSKTLD